MIRLLLSLSILLVHHDLSSAQPLSQHLLSLVSSESAFASATAHLGVRNGFLTFFADDAITFEPRLGSYKESLLRRPAPVYPMRAILRWAPEEGDVSASGDLGYLTGPYLVESGEQGDGPKPAGWFFSVWKRQADSTWKVFIDVGIETPPHGLSIDSVRFAPSATHRTRTSAGSVEDLLRSDSLLNGQFARGGPDIPAFLVPAVRLHRNGWFPIKGLDEVRSYLRMHPYGTATSLSAECSASRDLGYTYGTYTGSDTEGYYVRVWKHLGTTGWMMVADITTVKKRD